jgi:hypothetical protein
MDGPLVNSFFFFFFFFFYIYTKEWEGGFELVTSVS